MDKHTAYAELNKQLEKDSSFLNKFQSILEMGFSFDQIKENAFSGVEYDNEWNLAARMFYFANNDKLDFEQELEIAMQELDLKGSDLGYIPESQPEFGLEGRVSVIIELLRAAE